jgi:hypothetical protein
MPGIFDLKTPADLLAKLGRELLRLREHPDDVDHAFNFFTTAEHILDWLHPGNSGKNRRETLRNSEVLLALVSHVANGAKHFDKLRQCHNSVSNTELKEGAWAKSARAEGAWAKGSWAEAELRITLSGNAATEFGGSITALDLAEKVFAYWSTPGRVA